LKKNISKGENMLNRIKKHHVVFLSLLAVIAIASLFYLQNDQQGTAFIRSYERDKDFLPLVKLMNENKYWISERANFSPEKMLITRTPSNDPDKKGQVIVDVIEVDGSTAGFIAYYKKSPEQGFIWLLAVSKIFRGRGFGEKLVGHALTNLQGTKYVTIATRLINKPALSLYKKMGFVEQSREEDRGIITLIKRNP
jgi:ribosomal protein S18 acetylase RimI-like enzyme